MNNCVRNNRAGRLALLLILLTLGACGSPAERRTTRLLNDRMQDRMALDVKAGQASVQTLPHGTRVTLLGSNLFADSKYALDDEYPDIRANVIEAMLDPALMQVRVADTTTLPDDQRATRVANVKQYFAANGLGDLLQPAEPRQTATDGGPAGLTITINVQCPQRHDGTGYDGGLSKPICE